MRSGGISLDFRSKVVLLAVLLVAAIQLGTMLPILHELRERQQQAASEHSAQAGVFFDEIVARRTELTAAIGGLVRDDALRSAIADGDPEIIEAVLTNHLLRGDGAGEISTAEYDRAAELIASIGEAEADYRDIRNRVVALAIIALLVTLGAAIWLSNMVIFRERRIAHLAHHDSLSGLPTREIVVGEMRAAIGACETLAVVHIVLHRFDELASSLGHRTADRLIRLVAGRVREQLGDGQILGHLNYQEFVCVLPNADLPEAEEFVLGLRSLLRAGLAVGSANISLQIRAGIAFYPAHGKDASNLLRCAGIARGHTSHHQGSVGIYEPGQEGKSLESIRIVGDFARALDKGELWVEYQPRIDCSSAELVGAEALVRWQHPELGPLPPDRFIGAIEQAGCISQLTRWVLEEALTTLAGWCSGGLPIGVSVNISADDLIDEDLPGFLEALCKAQAVTPEQVTLEVTESAIMHDVGNSLNVISVLRGLGFRIAIDDFGTGHSSLAQLKRLPVDELKIDKSFVLNIADQRDEAVVRTAIELAHQFGLTAVAEGVEDEACRTRLQQLGCELAQGFLFSPALRRQEFAAWARKWQQGEGADILSLVDAPAQARHASA